jgi:class 3 adenylate cyclase
VRQLVESGKPLERGVEYRELTIMFCDIENFSTLAQRLPAQELLEILSEFFSTATEAIAEEGGTVDKFIGDAVMSFWGAPTEINQPELRACRAALKTIERLGDANKAARLQGRETVRARFGIHAARVLVGNVGSNERLSYTAIGDGVNIASRLEGINKEFSTTICLSDTVYQAVVDEVEAKPLRAVSVKGRTGEFMVYELLGLKPPHTLAEARI